MIRCGACNKKFDVPKKLSDHIKICQTASVFLGYFKNIQDFANEKQIEETKEKREMT